MNTQELIQSEIKKAIDVLRNGGTLVYPTDTIWGLGCDATNPDAIEKIYQIKKRDPQKSLLILIPQENLLMKYVKEVPEPAWDLVSFSERPLTIIYPDAVNLPQNLIAADGTIAIRVVKEGFAHQLLMRFNKPIVSTSANISGEQAPVHFDEINPVILDGVDYVVDLQAATEHTAKPSVIIQMETNGRFKFIRR